MYKILHMLAISSLIASIFFLKPVFGIDAETPNQSQVQTNIRVKDGRWYAQQVTDNARNNPDYATKIAEEALVYFSTNTDYLSHAAVLNESSYAMYFLADYPKAMQRAKQAEAFSQQYNLGLAVARSKILQANVLQSIASYEQAVALYQQVVQYYRTHNKLKLLARVLHNIANTYFADKKYQAALNFYKQSHQYSSSDLDNALFNLGLANTYDRLMKLDLAIVHFNRALLFYKKSNDLLGQELVASGLGSVYQKQNNFQKAIESFEQSLEFARKSNRKFHITTILGKKSESLLKLGKVSEALELTEVMLTYAIENDNKPAQANAHRIKMEIYEKQNNFDLFLNSLKTAQSLESEYETAYQYDQLAVMQAILEVETKDHQIKLLSSENKLQQLKIERQQITIVAIVGGLLFLITVLAFYFYRKTQSRLLTEQKNITQRLEELNELKSQLLANTSHELRTPLNGIIGMTQLLLENNPVPLDPDNLEQVQIIDRCGRNLLSLIDDILDLSQLQAGRLVIQLETFELNSVVEDCLSIVSSLIDKKKLKVDCQIEPSNLKVIADKKRIQQVFINLVGNAIKFSEKGTIRISAKQNNGVVEIKVKDQGEGIPEQDLDMIFQPFTQVDGSSRRKSEGSGLGLAITKELLMLHGSDILVYSTQGSGTEFTFSLNLGADASN